MLGASEAKEAEGGRFSNCNGPARVQISPWQALAGLIVKVLGFFTENMPKSSVAAAKTGPVSACNVAVASLPRPLTALEYVLAKWVRLARASFAIGRCVHAA